MIMRFNAGRRSGRCRPRQKNEWSKTKQKSAMQARPWQADWSITVRKANQNEN